MSALPTNISLYGKGVFTTIFVRNGQPLLWEKHWRRLKINADKLGIDISAHAEGATLERVCLEIEKVLLVNGRIRVTFIDHSLSQFWFGDSNVVTDLNVVTGQLRPADSAFRLSVSPFPVNSRSPLAGVKSCNYLEQILSLDEAKGRGFHEAVRVDERGAVTSGCMSNIFWLKNDRLYTPTLATGCLAGTTREYVLENVECAEVEAEIGELESADAIYLTSAGLGIVRVAEFDGRVLADIKHPIQTLWPPSV